MDQKLFNSVVSFMIIAWNMNDEMNCIWLFWNIAVRVTFWQCSCKYTNMAGPLLNPNQIEMQTDLCAYFVFHSTQLYTHKLVQLRFKFSLSSMSPFLSGCHSVGMSVSVFSTANHFSHHIFVFPSSNEVFFFAFLLLQ